MDFKLPDIGEGVHEGEVTKWLVKVGDPIQSDQPMVEVMTDKATVEIPSPVSGTIEKIHAEAGKTIEVGKVLVTIREQGQAAPVEKPTVEKPTAPKAAPQKEKSVETPKATPAQKTESEEVVPFNVLATPATRKLARDLGVDLKGVPGTGTHGRVTKTDIQMAYEGVQAAAPRSSHPVPAKSVSLPSVSGPSRGVLERIPLKGIRKRISESMSHSKRTAAHFTYVEEVDMSEIVKLRASVKPEAEKKGIKLTYLPFIIKALIPALQEFPFLNASLDDESQEIILKGDYNIGIATDTPNGLIVPVIKSADRKTIWELASDIHTLSEKARLGRSALEDLKGGTFTITNAGSIGGVLATPIINHPEVAILGVNAVRKKPVVKNDEICIADIMYLSISVDHRVVDGADAARFMNRLVYFLNEPTRLVFA